MVYLYTLPVKGMQAISLYSGAGGLDLGFAQAGVHTILANDSWNIAAQTYLTNRPGANVLIGGIDKHATTLIDAGRQNRVEMVFGGPPCQDFSTVGKKTGEGPRANQTANFVDVALAISPDWIVMENVNTITSIGSRHIDMISKQIKEAGYGITAQVLNAVDFGVPQFRRRFFLIAKKNGSDNDQKLKSLIDCEKCDRRTVRDYDPSIDTDYYYSRGWRGKRAIFSVDEPSPTILGENRPIPPSYKIHHNDATDDLGLVRPLTTEERASLQTFPETYRFIGNKTEREHQVGNSVPPMMARAVAEAVRKR